MRGHNGIDYRVVTKDTPKGHMYVYPMAPGTVYEATDQDVYALGVRVRGKGYGKFVRLVHDDGSQTIYGHLSKWYVKKGQRVGVNDIIGLTGNTGFSTGAHLHCGYRPPEWAKNYGNGYAGYIDHKPFLIPRKTV